MRIVLASGSPRRKEILDQIGMIYEVKPSEKEEVVSSTNPEMVVKELALMKAMDIAGQEGDNVVIIGADTVVAANHGILGKPKDEEHAVEMIKELSGKSHYVYTGVAIIKKEDGKEQIKNFSVGTRVTVAELTEEKIRSYVSTKEPMDKAGAYAIQGKFAPYITGIEGDYYNVVGFPIASVCRELEELGIRISQNWRNECRIK